MIRDNLFLIIILCIIVIAVIMSVVVIKISNYIHANRPCCLTDIVRGTLKNLAMDQVTRGLSYEEIYRKDGQIRANIMKKINAQYSDEEQDYSQYCKEYIYSLRDIVIDINSDDPQVLNKHADVAARKLLTARENYKQFISRILDRGNDDITPDEFFRGRKQQDGDCVGVYVIHNHTKDMYYVGQATRLYFRVNQHFTGHGNGDVYADYKYGDKFTIKLLKLTESGYDDLDKFEKDKIKEYNAYTNGYNRTQGNGKIF